MTVSRQAFEQRLWKLLQETEPVAKNVPKKVDVTTIQSGGSPRVELKEERGDVYLDSQFAKCMSRAISSALAEHVLSYINDPLVAKINELIGEYNQLRSDIIAAAIFTSATAIETIPTN